MPRTPQVIPTPPTIIPDPPATSKITHDDVWNMLFPTPKIQKYKRQYKKKSNEQPIRRSMRLTSTKHISTGLPITSPGVQQEGPSDFYSSTDATTPKGKSKGRLDNTKQNIAKKLRKFAVTVLGDPEPQAGPSGIQGPDETLNIDVQTRSIKHKDQKSKTKLSRDIQDTISKEDDSEEDLADLTANDKALANAMQLHHEDDNEDEDGPNPHKLIGQVPQQKKGGKK